MNHIGHIAFERTGGNLRLRCNHCGSEEIVADFESGGRPRRFGLGAFGRGDRQFAKCHQCLLVHDRGAAGDSAESHSISACRAEVTSRLPAVSGDGHRRDDGRDSQAPHFAAAARVPSDEKATKPPAPGAVAELR